MRKLLAIFIAFVATVGLFSQTTKVGGIGTTKVGGIGTTKVSAPVAAGISMIKNWQNRSSSTAALGVAVTPAAGRFLVVGVAHTAASVTLSDNIGGATGWTAITANTGFGLAVQLWYKASIPAGITTVTVTPATTVNVDAFVFEVSNVSAFTSGEFANSFFAGTATSTSGSLTTATANSVMFFLTYNSAVNSGPFTGPTNSFARYSNTASSEYSTGDGGTVVSYRIVSSTGTYSTAITGSVSDNGINTMAAFR